MNHLIIDNAKTNNMLTDSDSQSTTKDRFRRAVACHRQGDADRAARVPACRARIARIVEEKSRCNSSAEKKRGQLVLAN